MGMKRIAASLAAQMTAAGITPGNVTANPAYSDHGGVRFLAYAMDDAGNPVLGQWACSLRGRGDDWLLWDRWGVKYVPIVYADGVWSAREAVAC